MPSGSQLGRVDALLESANVTSNYSTKAPFWLSALRTDGEIRRSPPKSDYRNRAVSLKKRYPARMFAVPRYAAGRQIPLLTPSQQFSPVVERELGRVEGTASIARVRHHHHLLDNESRHRRGYGRVASRFSTLPPYQVDVIIDRTYQNFYHAPPIPAIPEREYTSKFVSYCPLHLLRLFNCKFQLLPTQKGQILFFCLLRLHLWCQGTALIQSLLRSPPP
ncbi:hypothetical protein COOONC_08652 [Cooperia oncophora]